MTGVYADRHARSRPAAMLAWLWAGDPAEGALALARETPLTWCLAALIVVMWSATEVLPGHVAVRHALGMSGFDLARGQWWRLFTPTLLNTADASGRIHTTALEHLLGNLLPLVLVGPRVERILGRARYIGLWVVGELLGRALFAIILPFDHGFYGGGTSVFAVGALQAAAVLDAVLHRRRLPAERRYLVVFAAAVLIEIAGAFGNSRGNNYGHLAGAAAAVLLVTGYSLRPVGGSVLALGLTATVALSLAGVHTFELRQTSSRLDATIGVGRSPYYVAAGEGSVWVSNHDDATVSRIDPAMNHVVATIRLGGGFASGIAIGDGLVWVVAPPRSVVAIDPRVNRVVRRVSVARDASDVAFGAGSVWVSSVGADVVTRIDPATSKVVAKIPVGADPYELDADSSSVWVASEKAATVSRIDPATNQIARTVQVDDFAADVAIGSDAVWVAARKTERIPLAAQPPSKIASPKSDVFLLDADGDRAWGTRDNTVVRFGPDGRLDLRLRLGVAITSGVALADGSLWVTDVARGRLFRVSL